MALVSSQGNDRKRVKVYELRNNDWFDRGTGFCTGQVVHDESKIFVESEDQPDCILLETKIAKDDGYQKQQDTLIVWTEPSGIDMALSFQEADGCASIWEFVSHVQQQLLALAGPDDALSDDAMDNFTSPVMLPAPQLGVLNDIDQIMRSANTTPQGRDSLGKFIIQEDYIRKLVPLVELAEDLEDLSDLHRLSTIMKTLILLNDTQIIEHMMSDGIVDGVVGALEYDQDFPNHKANHREYLQNKSRFKEVVPIEDQTITTKIHSTWRLQYLKDVVLARILDDPTFSVLNSLIFFNQVDIVTHLQANPNFLKDLFSLIEGEATSPVRRKDAVCFIQQCCAIAKNLQAPARANLYQNFIQNGLIAVIVYALGQREAPIRIAGTDILVAMIDHDPSMVRAHVFKAITEKKTPLTDTLIDLLLVEEDLGVKAQAADAIKILLDPQQNTPQDGMARMGDQFLPKYRGHLATSQQTESFIQDFYDNGAKRLFGPLKSLAERESVCNLTFNEQSLYLHLVEILMYFVRQHLYRSKFFIASESISARVSQLLSCPQKHLKLTALKFFRTCLGLQDEFYYQQLTSNHIFSPILDIVYETLPRDNLLNSACLELFEFIKREQIKPIIAHVVENYRQQLEDLTYVDLFGQFILRYDQMQGYNGDMEGTLFNQEDEVSAKVKAIAHLNGGNQRWQGVPEMDAQEEEYFNTSDDEDELAVAEPKSLPSLINGASPVMKPLVDYPDDEEEIATSGPLQAFYDKLPGLSAEDDRPAEVEPEHSESTQPHVGLETDIGIGLQAPPERLAEKRRREEDEEDELGKLTISKRRSSSASSNSSTNGGKFLRRKQNFSPKDSGPGKKIAISLAMKSPIETEQGDGDGG